MVAPLRKTKLPPSRAELYAEFEEATKDLKFGKDFLSSLEAVIQDDLITAEYRVLAWLKRRAWANYRLFAAQDDGLTPAGQKDCCTDLRLDKTTVSHAVAYLKARGYVRTERRLLIPVIAPQAVVVDIRFKRAVSPRFALFFEAWKVAHEAESKELEDARATIKRIQKVVLSAYKKSQTSEKNAGPSLLDPSETPEPADPPEDGGLVRQESGRAGVSSVDGNGPHEEQPPARPPAEDTFVQGLSERNLLPDGPEYLATIRGALGDAPVEHFFAVLDARLKRGRIGTGLLPVIAKKAREQHRPPPRPESDQDRRRLEYADVLAHPDEYDEESVEYARRQMGD